MNIIKKLTLRHLKNNKSRTVLTIIGICVSVALITAVFTGLYSFLDYKGRLAIYTFGDYHFSISASVEELEEVLGNDNRVESYGVEYNLGGKNGYRLKDAKYKFNSIGSWFVGDRNCLEQKITAEYDGRLPENSHEMLVEEKFITDNELDWKIGDTVSVESGYRYIGNDYFKFPKNGQYSSNENFDYDSTDSYKITGILHGNFYTKNNGTMLIRGADENQEGSPYAYVKLKKVTPFSIIEINSIAKKFHFDEDEKLFSVSKNSEYLQTKLALDEYCDMMKTLLPICAAVLFLIIAASVVLIHNSFAMSLNEKIKYLGMLSSVGATRKQKKKSVIFEAVVLSAIGIPIGVVSGIGLVAIVFSLIGDRIRETAKSGEIGMISSVSLDVKISFLLIVIVILIGLATVILSSLVPSKRASSVSAIDAIRQSEEIKIKHKIRTPILIKKVFGYEGALAFKNMKRNGAKSKIIVVSIALSLVLFLGCNYFCNLFVMSTGIDEEPVYQVWGSFNTIDIDKVEDFIDSTPEIKKMFVDQYDWLTQDTTEEEIPLLDELFRSENFTDEYKELVDYKGMITYRVIEDEVFNELCRKNGIDYKEYYDYEYGCRGYDEEDGYKTKKPVRVLLLNSFNHTPDSPKPFTEKVIGTKQGEMSNPEHPEVIKMLFGEDVEITPEIIEEARQIEDRMAYKEQYEVHGLCDYDEDNYIFHLDGKNSIVAFYPFSVYENRYEMGKYDDDGINFCVGIVTDNHAHTTQIFNEFIETNEIAGQVNDDAEWREGAKAEVLVLQVLMYGFIILISIITITNIVNTIANSVNNRKKEFAMLKSVGLTPNGFKKMLRLESLFYALEGTLFGLPLSILVCFIINKLMKKITIPFAVDVKMCLISVCAVFAVIGLTMIYSSAKVKNQKIIEELKLDVN